MIIIIDPLLIPLGINKPTAFNLSRSTTSTILSPVANYNILAFLDSSPTIIHA